MTYFILLIAALILMAFFTGNEIGLISCQKPRIMTQIRKGSRRAAFIDYVLKHPGLMLSTMLVGTNICLASASVFAKRFVVSAGIPAQIGTILISCILPIVMLIPEILPKNWFRQDPENRCLFFAPLLMVVYFILYPISWIMAFITSLSLKIFRADKRTDKTSLLMREDFRVLIRDSESAGVIDNEAADILDRSLDFYDLRVSDVLTPLDEVIMVPARATVKEAAELCRKYNVSRLPVMSRREMPDDMRQLNWIGVFSIYKAIFSLDETEWNTIKVEDCMKQLYSLQDSQDIPDVITNAQQLNCRLLAVRDDENRPVGVVTPVDVSSKLFS
ncbi:CNNM domain-containing protein [Lentisphaerota bacterium ZTH]|nr:DUF21 domain-containing protein [Lentisphaerota bacterium]WET05116.1 CNNM domain-containing protein [Lentisphaerota bacterium ZTH]